MVIDIHAHLYAPAYLERLAGAQLDGMSVERRDEDYVFSVAGRHFATWTPDFYDDDLRVEVMDANGVETQVLTLAPPMVYWAAPDEALLLSQMINDHLALVADRHTGRFVPGAVVPLQDPALAVRELRRAVLDLGHQIVVVGSNVNRTELDDPGLVPFWESVQELDIPVFVHPLNPPGMACMWDHRLDISVGFPMETTLAAARFILSGMADRYPELRICWAHLGGALPALADRIEMTRNTLPGSQDEASLGVREYLSRHWYDTTIPSHRTLRHGAEIVGIEQLMFGTDAPFFSDMTRTIADLVTTADFLSGPQRTAVMEENARRFLGTE